MRTSRQDPQGTRGNVVTMQQLTGVDASFLYMEGPTHFGHVSSLILYDPKGTDAAGYDATRELFAERLHLLEPMRRKLVEVPLGIDHPYWIEDPNLDLDFHIRQTAVPPPGTDEQLSELVSRIIARPLDRSRPLWELYVIYGHESGHIAHLTKVHHAAIDGVGGAQLLASILSLEPDAPPPPGELPAPEREPTQEEMLLRGLASVATRPYKQGRLAVRLLRELPQIGKAFDWAGLAKAVPEPVARAFGQTPRLEEEEVPPVLSHTGGLTRPSTRFNNKIGPHRRFAFTSVPLDEVKAVKTALGVTVNDVVLGMCAGALRTYLDKRGELPEESLRCMIPVSVRTEEQANTWGNRVSGMLAALATDVADPVARLQVIHEETLRAKQTLGAVPGDLLTDVAEMAPPALFSQATRVLTRTAIANRIDPPFNLIISNVPGPQFPLYAGKAEMLSYIPVSAVADTQGLNMTIMSYNGRCDFGLVACRDAVPDLWDLCHLLEESLEELKQVAGI
jgi:diacylglycerol O-acyltransferase / wax synthase